METIWPTSIAGWLGFGLAMIAFIDTINTRIKRPSDVAAARVEEHLQQQIGILQTAMATHAEATSRGLTDLKAIVIEERGDCGRRHTDMVSALRDHESRVRDNEQGLIQSREDRRHISQNLDELRQTIGRWREEDRLRDDRMLEAMVKLRGGKSD